MTSNPRINKACAAMKDLGVKESKVRSVLKLLLKTYDNSWDFIEDKEYQVLIDKIFEEDEAQASAKMKKSEPKTESKVVTMHRGKKKVVEFIVEDEEDDNNEEEAPLKSRLRGKRGRGCDNNIGSSSSNPTPKKTNKEDPKLKQIQLVAKDEEDDINEDESPLKRRLCGKPERGCDNNTSLSLNIPTLKKPYKDDNKHTQTEEEENEITELPPLKRYLRQNGERKSAIALYNSICPSFRSPLSMEPEELPPTMLLPADHIVAANDSLSRSHIIVNNEPFAKTKPMIPENCSTSVCEKEKSNMYVEEHNGETGITLIENTAMDVPSSETASELIKAGDESGAAADMSMALTIVLECDISVDGCGGGSNVNDITLGKENIEIPWVNEISDKVPPRFRYLTQNFVFRDAAVKFSLLSDPDDQCCFSCVGDCVDSSSCNCATAYTVDGVLKEDFLEARISEAHDLRKQVLRFCQECPLEKAKNEEILEPCKGHVMRKAIKECWIKCGCTKRCGNKRLQRGIYNKLEVFFTASGKGWGLRNLERLPQGSFVCEYIGEILTIQELYQRSLEDELTSPVILDAYWGSEESLDQDNKYLCLDGTRYGNISRFINHRCLGANLIEIPVHVETRDQHCYHLAFFTTRDIEAMEELTWDYGIDFNDDDSPVKPFDCLCGSRFCRNMKRTEKAKKVMRKDKNIKGLDRLCD